jgi:hypothetical protein
MTDPDTSGSDRPRKPGGSAPGPAIAFPSPVVPDHQDEVTVAPGGGHLEDNPAAEDDLLNPPR